MCVAFEEAMDPSSVHIFEPELGILRVKDPESAEATIMRGKWRCRDCTLKVPTVWSAYMDVDEEQCRECGKHRRECGACLWVSECI